MILRLSEIVLPELIASKHHSIGNIGSHDIASCVTADPNIGGVKIWLPRKTIATDGQLRLERTRSAPAPWLCKCKARGRAVWSIMKVHDRKRDVRVWCAAVFLSLGNVNIGS